MFAVTARLSYVLWMYQELRVLTQYFVVGIRAHNSHFILCLQGCFVFITDISRSHEWRPEVGWCRLCATKPLLKLSWVEQVDQTLGCSFAIKYDLQLGLLVDEHLNALVEKTLAPAHVCVKATEEEVHKVGLT